MMDSGCPEVAPRKPFEYFSNIYWREIIYNLSSVTTYLMRLRSRMSSPANTPGERPWRKVGVLRRGPMRGFACAKIGFLARAGLCLAIFLSGGVVALAPASSLLAAGGLCPGEGGTSGRVVAVGERLELILETGITLKIAGVDPPRPTPGDPDLDVRAWERLAQWLVGQEVLFRPLEPGPDRWGRVVAFVFAAAPKSPDRPEPARLSIGAALIDSGLARYESSAAARPCRSAFLAAEAGARAAGLGLWADPYYAIINADNRLSFADKAGSSVIVEGRIAGIASRRPRITLYFGPRRGWDFSVTISPRNRKTFEAVYSSLSALTGQAVRVRGLLDTRFGPQIEISDPDELEAAGHGQDPADGSPASR
ncbi:MAG: thermonuclease family protein [Beijerinckiaceae bacterium]